ncbi:cytochrome P450 2K1-like isoform X1 [Dendrobates tinctorius]|uniref:cytochrome P450 2K1-like isoform X1 n=1 Tax=Dendrobates tinctorius TaxID=92724 RepID=UPI003CC947C3
MAFIAYFLARADVLVYFSIFIALFIYWIKGIKKSTAKMPPGPMPLPVIGNLNLLDLERPHESLMQLSEKYGEIFAIKFGPKKTVILAGYKIIKEALVMRADDFGERAIDPIFKVAFNGHGVVFSNGEQWKSMRRFMLSTLRDFGMGKKSQEARIQDELIFLIESFKSHDGKPFNAHMLINSAVSSVICSIIFGKRFEYGDPIFQKLIKMLDENAKLYGTPKVLTEVATKLSVFKRLQKRHRETGRVTEMQKSGRPLTTSHSDDRLFVNNAFRNWMINATKLQAHFMELYNYYPFLGSLLGLHKKVEQNTQELRGFISQFLMNRRLELDANDIAGYIDAYLLKQEQETTKAQTHFNEENLYSSVLDLFDAGTETSSTTIRWGILLMMKYPEIQKKVQEEIKTHIKPGQLPTVEDRKKMPYTNAVIHEIQRFGNILPLNMSHSTPTDVYLRGYLIPKDTEVIPLLTSVLYDKTQWKTPYDFNPNHFLDENGKFVQHDAFMPFSVGRRACAGEGLAKMELFLFFTGLLQAFTFYPPRGVSREDLNLKPGVGFTLAPTPFMTCAKPNY